LPIATIGERLAGMPRQNVEILETGYRAFLSGDHETAFSVFAPDIEAFDDPRMIEDRVYRGRDGFARMLAVTTEGFEDVRYEAEEFIDVGDCVLVSVRRSGRGSASRVPVEEHQFHVWDMRAGQAVRFRLFLSEPDARAACGLEHRLVQDSQR
jgi:ketosteroid isomerase-like protein